MPKQKKLNISLSLPLSPFHYFSVSPSPYLDPFPPAPAGQKRYKIHLEPKENEEDFKVELMAGRMEMVDGANFHRLMGNIEEKDLEGWGYTYYQVTLGPKGSVASTMMMPLGEAAEMREKFLHLYMENLVRYNSKLPIVVYMPEDGILRYKIWGVAQGGREGLEAKAENEGQEKQQQGKMSGDGRIKPVELMDDEEDDCQVTVAGGRETDSRLVVGVYDRTAQETPFCFSWLYLFFCCCCCYLLLRWFIYIYFYIIWRLSIRTSFLHSDNRKLKKEKKKKTRKKNYIYAGRSKRRLQKRHVTDTIGNENQQTYHVLRRHQGEAGGGRRNTQQHTRGYCSRMYGRMPDGPLPYSPPTPFIDNASRSLFLSLSLSFNSLSRSSSMATKDPFPPAPAGQKRYKIHLEPKENEEDFKVELMAGRMEMVDGANFHRLMGNIEEKDLEGWGYTYYQVTLGPKGSVASTRMMPLGEAAEKREKFLHLYMENLVRYISKLPIVVYMPEDGILRYKIWGVAQGGREGLEAKAE
eukprot:gene961-558_t